MGQILADTIVADARRLLQDQSSVAQRWDDGVLLSGLNEGQRVAVTLKHDAYTAATAIDVSGGKSAHDLPADSVAFIRLTRNLGPDGETPGKVITMVSMKAMDRAAPGWHSTKPAREVLHGMFDERDERRFYVWPPVESGYVELIHTVLPPEAKMGSPISLDDIYAPALVAYTVYYGFAQDMDAEANKALAETWFGQFVQLLTGKINSEESLTRGRS